MSWRDAAACRGVDPEVFFPERGESVAKAKKVCAGCPVRDECLEYAEETLQKFGVWGGLSERQRRRRRRGRVVLCGRCEAPVAFAPGRKWCEACARDVRRERQRRAWVSGATLERQRTSKTVRGVA